jgi:hypothetical protein
MIYFLLRVGSILELVQIGDVVFELFENAVHFHHHHHHALKERNRYSKIGRV